MIHKVKTGLEDGQWMWRCSCGATDTELRNRERDSAASGMAHINDADLSDLRSENARLREALEDAVHLINTLASNPALSGRVFADFDITPLGMKIRAALAPAAKEQ